MVSPDACRDRFVGSHAEGSGHAVASGVTETAHFRGDGIVDLVTLIRLVLRRWVVVVPVLVVTVGAAVWMQRAAEPRYVTSGSVLLTSPEVRGSSGTAVDLPLIATSVEAQAGRIVSEREVVAGIDVEVVGDRLLRVQAIGGQRAGLESAVLDVLELLREHVDRQQDGVSESQRMRASLLGEGVTVEAGSSGGGFTASGNVVIEDPFAGVPNPYLASAGTARVLEVLAEGPSLRQQVEALGGSVDYEVTQQPRDPAPLLFVTVRGSDPRQVRGTFEHVTRLMEGELTERQERAGIAASRQVGLELLAAPSEVSDESGPLDRSVVTVLGLGGAAALGLALMAESITARRRTRDRGVGSPPERPAPRDAEPLDAEPEGSAGDPWAVPSLRGASGSDHDAA